MRCANCGNENFETLSFGRFTAHCAICGHKTHTATGLDTRKVRNAVIILAVLVLLGFSAWTLATHRFVWISAARPR